MLKPGDRLGRYEVVSPLGAGGMGEVYRARDSELQREVALKILPDALASDPDRLRRFEREAKVTAALSHPNVLTVFDVGHEGERTYLVFEMLEGSTLAEVMKDGATRKREALDYAGQVARGLAAAHARGIVHRDVKPANLFLTTTSVVKILDFGLARIGAAVAQPPEETTAEVTEPGVALGTVSYMSPEQAKGLAVDGRSDLFSLGVVLYEALSGRHPFRRASSAETVSAILRDEPPELGVLEGQVSVTVERLVRRCLEKRPEHRFQTANELALALELVAGGGGSRTRPPPGNVVEAGPAAAILARKRRLVLSAIAALLTTVGLVVYLSRSLRSGLREHETLRFYSPVQVTTAVGVEEFPLWSPDGKMLAYQSNQRGDWDIWLVQVGSGEPLNRTASYVGADQFPSFSPDGGQIAFWSEREGAGYFVMPTLAGAARKVATAGGLGPAHWSRDSAQLTFVVVDGAGSVFFETVSLGTGETRRVRAPGRAEARLHATWSPDETLVAFMDAPAMNSDAHSLMLLRLADLRLFPVTDGKSRIWSVTWSRSADTLLFVSNQGGAMDIWRQAVTSSGEPKGGPERVTTGLGVRSAALSPDGTKLAYSQGRRIANLWKVPILSNRRATWADAQQLTFDQAYVGFVSVTPDRRHVLFSSDRQGNQELWMMPVQGGEMRRLTIDVAADWSPVASPDGSDIAFYSNRAGNREIWVMPLSGGPARQVTHDEGVDSHPDWSPDGRNLVFNSGRSGNREIWIVPAAGGEARRITADGAGDLFPKWSPDGKWIVFRSTRGGPARLWRVRPEGGEPERLTDALGGYPRWSPDGTRIYFLDGQLWSVAAPGGQVRRMSDFAGRPGALNHLSLATDGKSLFFSWDDDLGDLWVMDVARGD